MEKEAWILSDDDCAQHVRKVGERDFQLIQHELVNPETKTHAVRAMTVRLDRHSSEAIGKILDGFGYCGMMELREAYGTEADQVLAECIFESEAQFEPFFEGTETECRKLINRIVSGEASVDWD